MRIRVSILTFAASALLPMGAFAASFSDVPEDHAAFEAVEALKEMGILQGYADGTFKPSSSVNRAEAVKIIVAPLVPEAELAALTIPAHEDVPKDAWYVRFVEAARLKLGIIDGPPKSTKFRGGDSVKKAEFLKMMLLAHKVDVTGAYAEIKLPLAMDVANPDEWFYPYVRYALSASVTMTDVEGKLSPGKELTRGEVAMLLYRFLMYKDGRRTQALLSETESEIVNILKLLDAKAITEAEMASARALLASRGALASDPDEAIVKAAVKTAEGFRALVGAYKAGIQGNLDEVIRLAGDAWHLAVKAKEYSPALETVTMQMQGAAKSMADEARRMKAELEKR